MLPALKSAVVQALSGPGVSRLFSGLTRDRVTIVMLHRFRDAERGVEGHDPQELRHALARLRWERYQLVALEELFRRPEGHGPTFRRAVAFTIDDGYLEHATVAAPIFAEFDCPVTTFVTTGFLDGLVWMWWDQIEYVFRHTPRRELSVSIGNRDWLWVADPESGFTGAVADCVERLKVLPQTERNATITRLAAAADVGLPDRAPAEYAPMSWANLRECEDRTMTFGPHSVTHPVLSRTTDEQARYEIEESWRRLRAESRHPLAVFAYPNGKWPDFGTREVAVLSHLGFRGAVVGEHDYADVRSLRQDPQARFRIPRFGYEDYLPQLIMLVSGAERARQLLRGKR